MELDFFIMRKSPFPRGHNAAHQRKERRLGVFCGIIEVICIYIYDILYCTGNFGGKGTLYFVGERLPARISTFDDGLKKVWTFPDGLSSSSSRLYVVMSTHTSLIHWTRTVQIST